MQLAGSDNSSVQQRLSGHASGCSAPAKNSAQFNANTSMNSSNGGREYLIGVRQDTRNSHELQDNSNVVHGELMQNMSPMQTFSSFGESEKQAKSPLQQLRFADNQNSAVKQQFKSKAPTFQQQDLANSQAAIQD